MRNSSVVGEAAAAGKFEGRRPDGSPLNSLLRARGSLGGGPRAARACGVLALGYHRVALQATFAGSPRGLTPRLTGKVAAA